eukprot:6201313-Pleurochrysis_carterae.AAC.1
MLHVVRTAAFIADVSLRCTFFDPCHAFMFDDKNIKSYVKALKFRIMMSRIPCSRHTCEH